VGYVVLSSVAAYPFYTNVPYASRQLAAYARAHYCSRGRVSQERVEIIGHPSRGLAGGAVLFTQLPAIDTSSLAGLSRFRHPQFTRLQHVDEKQKGYGV